MIIKKPGILISICFLMISQFSWSQEVVAINDLLNDTAFVEKLPIPMAAISVNSEQTREVIGDVDESLGLTLGQLDKIDSILNVLADERNKFQNQITEDFLKTSSTIMFDNYISDVKQVDDQVRGYREIVQAEVLQREKENMIIDKLLVIWNETYNADRKTDLSNTIKLSIRELIDTLKVTDQKIGTYLNDLLELELKLNEFHSDYDKLIKQIEKAMGEASKNLLLPDSDPIWRIYSAKKDTLTVGTKLSNVYNSKKTEVLDYYGLHRGNIQFALLIIILTGIMFFIIKYKILHEQIEDPDQENNAVLRLFRRPLSSALLVGLYLVYMILQQKPIVVDQLIYLAGLIPFSLVLINLSSGKRRSIIIYFSLILALAVFSEIGIGVEVFSRTSMLIITILAIILTVLVLKYDWQGMTDQQSLRKLFRVVVKTTTIVLIITLLGNLIGNYTLASILLYGVLSSFFLGISMYIFYLIIIGFFTSIMNSMWGQSYRIIKQYQKDILIKIRRTAIFVLSILFLSGILKGFLIFGPIYDAIVSFLVTPYNLGNFTLTIYEILLFILILIVTGWISRFIQFILEEQVLFKSKKQKDLSASISSLVKFGIITVGFFVAALASGFPLDKITLIISAFGVGIGFGLQNIFNNLVSGIILVFERPLQVGDTIEVGHLTGVVKSIGIRASTIRTFDGSEVIVPNGNLISNELINWTLSDSQRRLTIKVGVAYGTDPNEVIKILLNVAKKNKGLLEDPEPYVLFKEFGESSLGFELRCYTESKDWLLILSDLHVQVNNAIREAGMIIPFPQHDLHIKTTEPNIVRSVKSSDRSK